jgi:hypothetical protein
MDEMSKKKLEEILEKEPNNLVETEKEFLRARRSYLTAKQKEDYQDILVIEKEVKKVTKKK